MKNNYLKPKKLSLKTQLIIINSGLFTSFVILFYLLMIIIYSLIINNLILFVILYWIFAIFIFIIINIILIPKLLNELKEITIVLAELENLNFELNIDLKSNRDFHNISKSLNGLKDKYQILISEYQENNQKLTRYSEEQQKDFIYKKNLVSTISHEIKTPLTIIHATLSGIRDGIFAEDEISREMENILIEIEKTNLMLQEIINIYNIESSTFQLHLEKVSLNFLLDKLIDKFQKLIDKYKQNLTINMQEKIDINIDVKQFNRVLNNILLNAIVHSPKGEDIIINLFRSSKNVVLEFINTGVIIKENDLKHIFEPFYRVDKSRQKSDDYGNGLGLYLVKEILKKHNLEFGIINIEDAVKFYIVLPVVK